MRLKTKVNALRVAPSHRSHSRGCIHQYTARGDSGEDAIGLFGIDGDYGSGALVPGPPVVKGPGRTSAVGQVHRADDCVEDLGLDDETHEVARDATVPSATAASDAEVSSCAVVYEPTDCAPAEAWVTTPPASLRALAAISPRPSSPAMTSMRVRNRPP
jgi:hypothetical protein